MKNMLKRLFLITLVCIMTLSAAAFAEEADPALELAEIIAANVDFTQYPEAFADWDISFLKVYLREVGVLVNSDWVFDITSGDLTATNATAGVMYIDMTAASAMDMIFFFDAKEGEDKEASIQSIRENEAIVPNVEGAAPVAMDALLGGFCFSYGNGMDEDHIATVRAAIYALANHFDIAPDFIYQ